MQSRHMLLFMLMLSLSLAENKTCDFCYARGALVSSPYSCSCSCFTIDDAPLRNVTPVRSIVSNGSTGIHLLPPTCRYMETESLTLQMKIRGSWKTFVASTFFKTLRSALELKFDDQTYLHQVETISEEMTAIKFDIRDDGSGSSGAKSNTRWVDAHYRRLTENIAVRSPWVDQLQIVSVDQFIPKESPSAVHGGGRLFTLGHFDVASESAGWLFGAALCACLLPGIEVAFGDSKNEAEAQMQQWQDAQKRRRASNLGATSTGKPVGGWVSETSTTPNDVSPPSDHLDEDGFDAPPTKVTPVRSERRKSHAQAYEEYAKDFYGPPQPSSNNRDDVSPPARKSSMAQSANMRKKSYYYA